MPPRAGKRKDDINANKPIPKRQAIREEVEEIFASLQEKHGSTFSAAQLRLWANMLQVGTHRDTNEPPNVPMFGFNSKRPKDNGGNLCEVLSNVAEGYMRAIKAPTPDVTSSPPHTASCQLNEMGVSPGKCASQYIEQLKQLHELLELTAINKEEYEEQKSNILKKMHAL